MSINAPRTETELLSRAQQIAGLSLQQLAEQCGETVPANLHRDKGWVGQLLEKSLGATAASKSEPDFQLLGIELKTIPINHAGKPRESTFVSTIPLLEVSKLTWETSFVHKKLAHVLWIPIAAEPTIPLAARQIGTPLLWRPTAKQEAILKQDWQELTDMISLGQLEEITAHLGTYLQVRPKGQNAKSLCWGIGATGEKILTLPRGFYLRPKFTEEILREYYL